MGNRDTLCAFAGQIDEKRRRDLAVSAEMRIFGPGNGAFPHTETDCYTSFIYNT